MHRTATTTKPDLSKLDDEALLVAWDEATARAYRYNWGPKTTAEVERLEAEVNRRGIGN